MPEVPNDYAFTPRAQQVLALSRKAALRFGGKSVEPTHLLLAILRLRQGIGYGVLESCGQAQVRTATAVLDACCAGNCSGDINLIGFTSRAAALLYEARKAARSLKHEYTGTEHILLALASDPSGPKHILAEIGAMDEAKLRKLIRKHLDPTYALKDTMRRAHKTSLKKARPVRTPSDKSMHKSHPLFTE